MINLLYAFLFTLPAYELHGPGALAYTPVLEAVAQRRLANNWGLDGPLEGVLIATADCEMVGKRGWLLVSDGRIVGVIVVDCENRNHAGQMASRGILADVSDEGLKGVGWMVVR